MPQEEYELIQPWVANIATAMDDKRRDYEKSTADQQIDQTDQQWKYMRRQTKWREEKLPCILRKKFLPAEYAQLKMNIVAVINACMCLVVYNYIYTIACV